MSSKQHQIYLFHVLEVAKIKLLMLYLFYKKFHVFISFTMLD